MIPYILLIFLPLLFSFLRFSTRNGVPVIQVGGSRRILESSCVLPVYFFLLILLLSLLRYAGLEVEVLTGALRETVPEALFPVTRLSQPSSPTSTQTTRSGRKNTTLTISLVVAPHLAFQVSLKARLPQWH